MRKTGFEYIKPGKETPEYTTTEKRTPLSRKKLKQLTLGLEPTWKAGQPRGGRKRHSFRGRSVVQPVHQAAAPKKTWLQRAGNRLVERRIGKR